jgi:hypothetical protein
MSQPPDNEKVTKNNERLFSIYENHLRSPNVKDYTETAAKLIVWLGNSKAYYTTARPMVCLLRHCLNMVTLNLIDSQAFNRACQKRNGVYHPITYIPLEQIAQMTVRGAVGYPLDISVPFMPAQWLDHPLTASYVMLVQATRPFRDLFVEMPLQSMLSRYFIGTSLMLCKMPSAICCKLLKASLFFLFPNLRQGQYMSTCHCYLDVTLICFKSANALSTSVTGSSNRESSQRSINQGTNYTSSIVARLSRFKHRHCTNTPGQRSTHNRLVSIFHSGTSVT